MNMDKWEDRVIQYFEGEISVSDQTLLKKEKEINPDVEKLFNTYKDIYGLVGNVQEELPPASIRTNFNKFLEAEISKETGSSKSTTKVSKGIWTILALLILGGLIWIVMSRKTKDSEVLHFAQSENQRIEEFENTSPATRIKTLRVNYNQESDVDDKMVETLLDMLSNDPSSNVRLAVVETLSPLLRNDNVREGLVKALKYEEDGFVKLEIINALGKKMDATILETFGNLVNDNTQEKFVKDEAYLQMIQFDKKIY